MSERRDDRPVHDVEARPDVELLAAVRDGDRGALHELFRRHEPWIAARVRRRCADPSIVDEVVQDTFLTVWRNADRYRGTGDVAGQRVAARPGRDAAPRPGARLA